VQYLLQQTWPQEEKWTGVDSRSKVLDNPGGCGSPAQKKRTWKEGLNL